MDLAPKQAILHHFIDQCRNLPPDELPGALDLVEFVLQRAVDHGHLDSQFPKLTRRDGFDRVPAAFELLRTLSSLTVREASAILHQLREFVARRLDQESPEIAASLRAGGPRVRSKGSKKERTTATKVPHPSGACPTFFRGCVARARASRAGYSDPGYHLAIHARELVAGDIPDEAMNELDLALEKPGAEEHVWIWLRRTLPRCMALVPTRRKATFLRGIATAIEEGRV